MARARILTRVLALILTAAVPAFAQAKSHAAPATLPALFLSDIHLDPYFDPAKVPQLNSAPAAEWPSILAAPDSPTRAKDFAALDTACPDRGADTDDALWRSALKAIHSDAATARFATVSGDLLAHQFDCKYRKLVPKGTASDYVAFTQKTVDYIVTSLRAAIPGVPVYFAYGNNDSGCTDYHLDGANDAFLTATAPLFAAALPKALSDSDRSAIQSTLSTGGYYTALLPAPFADTRLIVLDNTFSSTNYAGCDARPDPKPAAAQLDWLAAQLTAARQHHERVWFMGHIPPGVNIYASARKAAAICFGGAQPQMYLATDGIADLLAQNADIVHLAIFGHTHSDEMKLITSENGAPKPNAPAGVPLKVVPSITPINGNRPTFTLARINPATATLSDYTVIMASTSDGADATWSPEYTFSSTYHKRAYDAASVAALTSGFRADPAASMPASQAYLRQYGPGEPSTILQFVWAPYTCSMAHNSAKAVAACACSAIQ